MGFGRLLLVLDGVFFAAVAGSMLVNALSTTGMGRVALLVAALPLAQCALASPFCATEGEQLAAVPVAIFLHMAASLRIAYIQDPMYALPTAIALLLHLLLYLPLPVSNPDSNHFNVSIVKQIRAFTKLMSQPVGGLGDEGPGAD